MDGEGLSLRDGLVAMHSIGNRVFKQKWKLPKEKDPRSKYDDSEEDDDPTRKAIRNNLKKMEASSLKLVADRLMKTKNEDVLVTHATDSTTRKRVGYFAPKGLHINRDIYLPLSTLSLQGRI